MNLGDFMRKIILTCVLGNVLEWYDFALFASLAPIFSKIFFPSSNHIVSLLGSLMVFAVGFLVRPIGAVYFGNRGDRRGRKHTLILSTIIMTIPTVLIGILPTYAQIGIIAPICLLALRVFQGLSVSGEYSGTITFLSEMNIPNKNALITSLSISGAAGGMILGAVFCAALTHILSTQNVLVWGWRIPFLFSIVLGALSIYMRYILVESQEFLNIQKGKLANVPILSVLREHSRELLCGIAIFSANVVLFYIVFVYIPTSLVVMKKVTINTALWVNIVGLFFVLSCAPLFGFFSDRYGKRNVLFTGALATIFFVFPLFYLYTLNSVKYYFLAQVALGILAAWYVAALPAAVANLFPTALRFSGVSLTINLATSLLGGTAPLIVAFFIQRIGGWYFTPCYIMFFAFISLFVVNSMGEKK
jgi:MHS family proline/betaine transporter-like MFS transporter